MSEHEERLRRWNERYSRSEETYEFAPSPPLPDAIAGVAPGRALDLACGAGRHAFFLAEHGWRVVAVDGASAGIDLLTAEANRRGLAESIETHVGNLMSEPRGFVIEPASYDLICDFYFLDRTSWSAIRDGVRPGGMFVAAIHITRDAGSTHPRLLAPGELENVVTGWGFDIVSYTESASPEGGHDHDTAMIVARAPLMKD